MPSLLAYSALVGIDLDDVVLEGDLSLPGNPQGIVLFAHGTGSSRLSPRNRGVAHALHRAGLATLLLDLLTPAETYSEQAASYAGHDIPLLAHRFAGATRWVQRQRETAQLPIGYFGASSGGGVALIAAALLSTEVRAVVSRGGRVDLAGSLLPEVQAPTLLIVGGRDIPVLELNEEARARMRTEVRMEVVPYASHLFQEPGALERVSALTTGWLAHHLRARGGGG